MNIYKKLFTSISINKGKGVKINPSLCFYNPNQVYEALKSNKKVLRWLEYISNHYVPEKRKVLLLYPCSTDKPYYKSRSYKILFKTLSKLGNYKNNIHPITISEPFGLVPEEFYGKKSKWHDWEDDWYDCPGLFEWWCKKYGLEYNYNDLDESIDILAKYVSQFFKKVDQHKIYSKKIALVRTCSSSYKKKIDHTHRRIIEKARELSGTEIKILPDIETVKKIVEERGRFAWDMYGVAHPLIQKELLDYLRGILFSK